MLLRWMHLIQPDGRQAFRPSFACMAVAWLPMALIAVVERLVTGRAEPIVRDPAVHVRLLLAIPLFFVAESLLDELSGVALKRFVRGPYGGEAYTIERLVRSTRAFRDAVLPEAIIFALAVTAGILVLEGAGGASGLMRGSSVALPDFSPSRLWYGLVALPMFFFLQLRFLYRWALWARVLLSLAESKLDLMPTHPDFSGGLGAVAEPVPAFAVFVLGNAAVVATHWSEQMALRGAHLKNFAATFVALVVVALLLALAPMVAFTRSLWTARLTGLRQYGHVAMALSRAFHGRWINRQNDDTLLGNPDPSSLIDMQSSYQNVERMRLFPFGPRPAVLVVGAVLVPVLPLVALEVPIGELLSRIGGAMLGGLPP
jgi:hypothetical protein